MNKPNVVPGQSLFHLIGKQVAVLSEDIWTLTVTVETNDPDESTELLFSIPVAVCTQSFTTFKLLRHVDSGWVLVRETDNPSQKQLVVIYQTIKH